MNLYLYSRFKFRFESQVFRGGPLALFVTTAVYVNITADFLWTLCYDVIIVWFSCTRSVVFNIYSGFYEKIGSYKYSCYAKQQT